MNSSSGALVLDFRLTLKTLVWLAVVEQVTDAVCRVLEQGCHSKDDDTDRWIDKRNGIERGD
jgi:hypothetical protein